METFSPRQEKTAVAAFSKFNIYTSGGNWGAQFWSEGSYTNVFQRARGDFSGYGFNLPTQDFFDEFETWEETIGDTTITKVDPRRGYTIYKLGETASDWGELNQVTTGMPHSIMLANTNHVERDAALGDPNPNGGSNDRVICWQTSFDAR